MQLDIVRREQYISCKKYGSALKPTVQRKEAVHPVTLYKEITPQEEEVLHVGTPVSGCTTSKSLEMPISLSKVLIRPGVQGAVNDTTQFEAITRCWTVGGFVTESGCPVRAS
ncbi:uncharacterized protein LOC135102133 isoform X2 [Scylla paramamosain]|uniref:uncharacterized protein LOC135102133 isoform X2 n=1 Tax=Scylla paramamosain TaxID=85552 RepID=UPI003082DA2C